MCWWAIAPFVIFAVLDVSLAVNLCINCSFFTFMSVRRERCAVGVDGMWCGGGVGGPFPRKKTSIFVSKMLSLGAFLKRLLTDRKRGQY